VGVAEVYPYKYITKYYVFVFGSAHLTLHVVDIKQIFLCTSSHCLYHMDILYFEVTILNYFAGTVAQHLGRYVYMRHDARKQRYAPDRYGP